MTAVAVRDLGVERPIVEALIGRTLRRAEQAIDVLRLDQALERAKEDLEQAIRDEMLLATAAWLRGSAVRPAMHVTEKMIEILDELRVVGREEAELELERLGYRGVKYAEKYSGDLFTRDYVAAEAPEGRDVDGYIRRELGGITARIEDELVGVDLGGASQSAIAQALLRVPGARDLASRVISTALIDGMGQTWEENRDLVGGWQYTAILDGGTCESCAPLDGTTYATIEELFVVLPDFGPNPECLGGGRCRCRAVPLPADEGGQPPPPPPEPTVDPSLPQWRQEATLIQSRLAAGLDAVPKFRADLTPKERLAKLVDGDLAEVRSGDVASGTAQVVPTAKAAAIEQDVLRAGEVVEQELDRRIGVDVTKLEGQRAERAATVAAKSDVYKTAREAYTTLVERYRAELRAIQPIVRADLAAARDVDVWQVTSADVMADERVTAIKAVYEDHVAELKAASDAALTDTALARAELADVEAEIQGMTRTALREILEEHRGMGAGDEQAWAYTTSGTRGAGKQILEQAADLYPTDWIARGRVNPLKVTFRKNGRGYHSPGRDQSELVVSGGDRSKLADPDGFSTAIHELGHHLEHTDPRLKFLEWAFYQRRTRELGYGAQERDYRFPTGLGYGRHETFRPDEFVEKYMGKTYGNSPFSSHEILTMGLEAVWTGSYPLDAEMRRFILGLLATL